MKTLISKITYFAVTLLRSNQELSVSVPNSHLEGGMTYQEGKLTVPTPGRYHIYAQLYSSLKVNNEVITMI